MAISVGEDSGTGTGAGYRSTGAGYGSTGGAGYGSGTGTGTGGYGSGAGGQRSTTGEKVASYIPGTEENQDKKQGTLADYPPMSTPQA